eukprot:PhF_6_TR37860/c0_g1_i1/m.56401
MKFAELLSKYMEEDAEIFAESLDYHRLKVIIRNSISEKSFLVVLTDEIARLKSVFEGRTWSLIQQAEAMLKKTQAISAGTIDALVARAVRIENFYHLNTVGIRKICKKFVKYVKNQVIPPWDEIAKPLLLLGGGYHGKFSYLVSQLYQRIRVTLPSPGPAASPSDLTMGTSLKFVLEEGRALELMLKLSKRFPVSVGAEVTEATQQITTIYYDNTKFDAYHNRTSATDILRVRYYGKLNREGNVFVEKKKHEVHGKREENEKERFSLPVARIHQFLYKEWDPLPFLQSIIDDKETLQSACTLATEVQAKVQRESLVPVVRIVNDRVAYEAVCDGENVVRITLDSQICCIKEDVGMPKTWVKTADQVSPTFRMSSAVIEIKTPGQIPKEIIDIVQSVEAKQYNFSKYRTAVAVHYKEAGDAPPEWFQEPTIADTVSRHRHLCNPTENASPPSSDRSDDRSRSPGLSPRGGDERAPLIPAPVPPPRPPAPAASPKPPAGPIPGKVIIRLEPKVFFANERTFLHWQHQSVLVLLLGAAMLSYHPENLQGLYTGCGLSVLAIGALTILYSLFRFYWRLKSIELGEREGYIDRYGPPLISVFIFIALLIVIVTVIVSGDSVAKNPLKSSQNSQSTFTTTSGSSSIRGVETSSDSVSLSISGKVKTPWLTADNSLLNPILDTFGSYALDVSSLAMNTAAGGVVKYFFHGVMALCLLPIDAVHNPLGTSIDVLVVAQDLSRQIMRCAPIAERNTVSLSCTQVPTNPMVTSMRTSWAAHYGDKMFVVHDAVDILYVSNTTAVKIPVSAKGSVIESIHVDADSMYVLWARGGQDGCVSLFDLSRGVLVAECIPSGMTVEGGIRSFRISQGVSHRKCSIAAFMPSKAYYVSC